MRRLAFPLLVGLVFGVTAPARTVSADSIHDAAMSGDVSAIVTLLAEGANPNALGDLGPLLYLAIFTGHSTAAQLLLEKGADPNVIGTMGSALSLAMEFGGLDLVEALVDSGADPKLGGRRRSAASGCSQG